MTKAIIFDFFDVIHRDHQKAWLAANGYKREGGFAEASELLDTGRIDYAEYLARYAALSGKTPEQVAAEFQGFAKVDRPLIELIEQLGKTYKIGLISNAHTNELSPILDRHDLHRLFDEICISSEVGIAKPDPKIFLHMAERLDVEPEECIFTDDNPDNVRASKKVGMHGLIFTDFDNFQKDLQKTGVFETDKDLVKA